MAVAVLAASLRVHAGAGRNRGHLPAGAAHPPDPGELAILGCQRLHRRRPSLAPGGGNLCRLHAAGAAASGVNTVSWRDPIHLLYAGHVVLVGLSILSLTGLAGEYLWPDNAWWNDKAPVVLPAASLGWAALFIRELVS